MEMKLDTALNVGFFFLFFLDRWSSTIAVLQKKKANTFRWPSNSTTIDVKTRRPFGGSTSDLMAAVLSCVSFDPPPPHGISPTSAEINFA